MKQNIDVEISIENVQSEWNGWKEQNREAQIDSLVSSKEKIEEEIKTLKDVVTKDYSERENLRFYNIPEGKEESNEECILKLMEVLKELKMDPQKIHFHAIHRVCRLNGSNVDDEESTALPSQAK